MWVIYGHNENSFMCKRNKLNIIRSIKEIPLTNDTFCWKLPTFYNFLNEKFKNYYIY